MVQTLINSQRIYGSELDYVFKEDYTTADDPRKYSGTIVSNRVESRFILTSPMPDRVKTDLEVVRDCGLITRANNESGRLITLLAGGMTTGVWVAAKIMTANQFIEQWYRAVNPDEREPNFEIIFECPVQNLSVELDSVRLLRTRRLASDDVART